MNLIKISILISVFITSLLANSDCASCPALKEQAEKNNQFKNDLLNDTYLNELYNLDTAESNWNLGLHFLEKDKELSQKFLEKAAEKKYPKAYHQLAILNVDNKDKMIEYFIKSVESGFKNDLLNLFIATNEILYLHKALDENIEYAYNFAAKYFFDKPEGRRYAEEAYNRKESFVEYFHYKGNVKILEEGVSRKDIDSISLFSDTLIKEEKYRELINISDEIENDARIYFNRSVAFSKLGDFRKAKFELNQCLESLSDADPIYNRFINMDLMKEKIKALESYICSNANVCRDF